MKLILKIARTELRNLFFSPVAWVLSLIFLLICAFFYTTYMTTLAGWQESLQRTTPSFKQFDMPLTPLIIMNMRGGFIGNIFSNLYLFIPLLTMGLINREFNNGTVKLLYSSPVKLSQIVWGKYLAIMAYNMLLSAIMVTFMILGAFSIKDADLGHMLTGVIAFFLVVCAYTAIGMFMSSITNYQIVAAISTFILLFVLQRVGGLWQEYDFVRDLTYFLSINGKLGRMTDGLITTRDVMYYVLITYMFVTFSYLSLRHGRELVSKFTKAGRYLAVFASVIAVGYLTSRPGYIGYWDGTRTKSNTITAVTQDILSKMQDEPMEVTLYANLLDDIGFGAAKPSERNNYIWGFWDRYVRFKSNIKFNYALFYDWKDGDSSIYKKMPNMSLESIAKEYAKRYQTNPDLYMGPKEIRKQIDLQQENMRCIMQLKYKGKKIFLRMYKDSKFWPNENHVAAALKRLCTDTIPKIYASTGNYERSIHKLGEREYNSYSIQKLSRAALINHGFEFDTLNLTYQNIPADATALVLADPKVMLNDTVTGKLKKYIEKGGNLLVLGEPGKQHVLNPLVQQTGVQLMPGTLVQLSKNEMPHMVKPFHTMDYPYILKGNEGYSNYIRERLQNGDSVRMLHPGAVPLSYSENGFTMKRLFLTGPKGSAWVKAGHLVIDSAPPVFTAHEGDYRLDSFTVAMALSRQVANKEQKIAIVGDADFLSYARSGTNFLGVHYLSWMTDGSFPVIPVEIQPIDLLMSIGPGTAQVQKIIMVWILPAAILILGSVILLRRKRQ